jgi:retron-type reverse transcriptase|tara:strand:- start:358 stop:1566 length:1209 start_codon:yes stop_codon:yes gene_type:complete
MQLAIFNQPENDKILTDLFQAYFNARKNKRNTRNALAFEKNYEENIFKLHEDIISGIYTPSRNICFIVNHPVKREIFAANFRDRVVHHFIYNYISPIFEGTFINDSYSCRVGKGIHYGINRLDKFIRSCSQNYSEDTYILKLDIQGYFMAINRDKLFQKVTSTLRVKTNHTSIYFPLIINLIKKTIYTDPIKNCIMKSPKSAWDGLPQDKSLFTAKPNCGLPIGNLTSQIFANIYLNELDHFIKRELKIKYYGRYVDDFIMVHKDKVYLRSIVRTLRKYLINELNLKLHEKKIYFQHYSKGVKYLGAVIKPHRVYVADRTKGKFFDAIKKQNEIVKYHKPDAEQIANFISSMNSYLGIMKHFKTYKMRKRMLFKHLSGWWWNRVYLSGGIKKFVAINNLGTG